MGRFLPSGWRLSGGKGQSGIANERLSGGALSSFVGVISGQSRTGDGEESGSAGSIASVVRSARFSRLERLKPVRRTS
jgi:hypothetical protein